MIGSGLRPRMAPVGMDVFCRYIPTNKNSFLCTLWVSVMKRGDDSKSRHNELYPCMEFILAGLCAHSILTVMKIYK